MVRRNSALLLIFGFAACQGGSERSPTTDQPGSSAAAIIQLPFTTTGAQPHDTTAFTEGFLVHDGQLYESTAHVDDVPESRSWFGPVDVKTGKIAAKVEQDKYFGEGICFLGDKVYQLTYTEKLGFIYDAKTFKKLGEFQPPGKEGWGMTTDGHSLLISDGTSTIWFVDPATLQTTRKLLVTENGVAPDSLNELEFIKGYIYANRYTKDYIFKIDPASGNILGRLDCSSLAAAARNKYPGSKELNGIAYDSAADKVYITGKCWPDIYTLKL